MGITSNTDEPPPIISPLIPPPSTPPPSIPEVRVRVTKKYRDNFNSIRISYGRMFYEVKKIFKENSPSLENIKELLSFCSDLGHKVDSYTNIFSILRLIQDECSLTDVGLLACVVEDLKITEAKELMINYKKELNKFCHSVRVDLCLEEQIQQFDSIHHLQCELVIFELDWKPEEHMLQHIRDILSKVSELLGIKYIKLSTDSLSQTFSTSVAGSFPPSLDQALEKWMEEGSVDLTITCRYNHLFVHAEELQKVPGSPVIVHIMSFVMLLHACINCMVLDSTAFII